jgi:hypothetical protein
MGIDAHQDSRYPEDGSLARCVFGEPVDDKAVASDVGADDATFALAAAEDKPSLPHRHIDERSFFDDDADEQIAAAITEAPLGLTRHVPQGGDHTGTGPAPASRCIQTSRTCQRAAPHGDLMVHEDHSSVCDQATTVGRQ